MDWLNIIVANEYLREFLRAFASSAGGAAGPIVIGGFGALWAKAFADKRSTEIQLDRSNRARLAVPKQSSIMPADFHAEVQSAYCSPKSLPQLKRDGTLHDLVTKAVSLNDNEKYIGAIKNFLVECYNQTNKCKKLDRLLKEAANNLQKPADMTDDDFNKLKACERRFGIFGWIGVPFLHRSHRRERGVRHTF